MLLIACVIVIHRRLVRAGIQHGLPGVVRGGDPAEGGDSRVEGQRHPGCQGPQEPPQSQGADGHRRKQMRS